MGGSKTYPGHQGIDFNISDHIVVAAAPGIIIGAEDDYQTNPDLKEIGARIVVWYGNGFYTQYNDMKTMMKRFRKVGTKGLLRALAGMR